MSLREWAEVANLRLAEQGTQFLPLPSSELARILQSTNVDKPPTLSITAARESRLRRLCIRNGVLLIYY
jgi:hypothetical protein